MSKNYNDIMDKITLSDEARNRILDNISKVAADNITEDKIDVISEDNSTNNQDKIVPIRNWKKPGSIAAALAVVVIGGSIIMLQTTNKSDMATTESAATGTAEYAIMDARDESADYKTEDFVEGEAASPKVANDINGYSETSTIANPIVEYKNLSELSEAMDFEVKEISKLPFQVTSTSYCSINDIAQITYYGKDAKEVCFRQSKILDIDISGVYEGSDLNVCTWQDDDFNYSIVTDASITTDEIKDMKNDINHKEK